MDTGLYTTFSNTKVAAARWRPCGGNCSCPLHANITVPAATQHQLRETLEMIDAHILRALHLSQRVPDEVYSRMCSQLGYNPDTIPDNITGTGPPASIEIAAALRSIYIAAINTANQVGKLPGFVFTCSDGAVKAHIFLAGFCISARQAQA